MSTATKIARNRQAASRERAAHGLAGETPQHRQPRLVFAYGQTVSDYLLTSTVLENGAAHPHLFKDKGSENA